MNTKEKARELVEKFKKNSSTTINDEVFADYDRLNGKTKRTFKQVLNHSNLYHAKQCALIAVEEKIRSMQNIYSYCGAINSLKELIDFKIKECNDIKKEIEKL